MSRTVQSLLPLLMVASLAACSRSETPAGAGSAQICAAPLADSDSAQRPLTIPALQQWQIASGSAYQYGTNSRIVVAPDSASLLPVAQLLAEDLHAQGGRVPTIVSGTPRAGDVGLSLGRCNSKLGHEGYGLAVGSAFEIQAATADGVFYGTRTLLQLLHQGNSIIAGRALDWPRYPERGLAIDNGNDFYTAAWIQTHLREIAYLKMNTMHLHFTDSGGFRVESTTHPEIVAADHLSTQELRDIVALARRYHITIFPEIDMPGHMTAMLAAHPEFQLKNALGQATASALDITNPAAEKFMQELVAEYLPIFPGQDWIVGGDEYLPAAEVPLFPQLLSDAQTRYGANANAKDSILGFFNRMDDFLRARGKTSRIYNDELGGGSAVTLNKDVIVEWWTDFSPLSDPSPPLASTLLAQGYTIKNIGSFPTYYNGGTAGAVIPTADPQSAYEHWEVNIFAGSFFSPGVDGNVIHPIPPETIAADEPRNLGSKVFVWGGGEGEAGIAVKIFPRLRVMAQKTWNSPALTPSYAEFQNMINTVGHAPGYALP